MPVLYVTEQRSILRKTSDRLIVEKEGQVLMEVPCLKLDTVMIFGNVQVTTQALVEMLDHGIELAILSTSGQLRGQLTPPKARNIVLRMRQYEASHSERSCLTFAREVVAAKIESSVAVLRRFRMNHPKAVSLAEVKELERTAQSARAAVSLDSLRGVEGASAARYFRCLEEMVPPAFGFNGRNRRPPRDPMNALLSFGYVLVGNELQALLDAMGFDPYLGFFHQVDYGSPSLALDLLEEFRAALVDRFSARILNLGILKAADFMTTPEKGTILGRDSLKRYFVEYEKELNTPLALGEESLTWRQLFRRQAERLARALMDDVPYEAFRLPC
ncbi:MAG: CRISPR-associated endonuclease Cas1 [Acidobacteriota bacterium]